MEAVSDAYNCVFGPPATILLLLSLALSYVCFSFEQPLRKNINMGTCRVPTRRGGVGSSLLLPATYNALYDAHTSLVSV